MFPLRITWRDVFGYLLNPGWPPHRPLINLQCHDPATKEYVKLSGFWWIDGHRDRKRPSPLQFLSHLSISVETISVFEAVVADRADSRHQNHNLQTEVIILFLNINVRKEYTRENVISIKNIPRDMVHNQVRCNNQTYNGSNGNTAAHHWWQGPLVLVALQDLVKTACLLSQPFSICSK